MTEPAFVNPLEPFGLLACGLLDYLGTHQGLSPALRELFNEIDPRDLIGLLHKLHAGRAAANDLFGRLWQEAYAPQTYGLEPSNPFADGSIRFPPRDEAAAAPSTEDEPCPTSNGTTSS